MVCYATKQSGACEYSGQAFDISIESKLHTSPIMTDIPRLPALSFLPISLTYQTELCQGLALPKRHPLSKVDVEQDGMFCRGWEKVSKPATNTSQHSLVARSSEDFYLHAWPLGRMSSISVVFQYFVDCSFALSIQSEYSSLVARTKLSGSARLVNWVTTQHATTYFDIL